MAKTLKVLTLVIIPANSFCEEDCSQKAEQITATEHKLEGTNKSTEQKQRNLWQQAQDKYLCAAAMGNTEAGVKAVDLSLQNKAKEIDQAQIRTLLKNAAEKGNAEAALALAVELCGKKISGCDAPSQAKSWFELAILNGNSTAAVELGLFYERGYETAPNLPKALGCYETAAKLGNPVGAKNLDRLKKIGAVASGPCLQQ